MNAALAEALLRAGGRRSGPTPAVAQQGLPADDEAPSGGRVTDGPTLDPYVRERVEAARRRPP
eukprot:681559-Pleurochrysis_carterae.AAC.1